VHHLVLESWSRRSSPIHARDARAKVLVLLVFLIAVSTTTSLRAWVLYASLCAVALAFTRLPPVPVLARILVILPFVASFTLVTWLAGQPERAFGIFVRSLLSAAAALILVATTPINDLLRGLESLGTPRTLILVIQFLHRYLFVITEQAQHMLMAARARGSRFHSAAGAIGVLFARSWERADGIYQSMLARGFTGRFAPLACSHFSAIDAAFLCGASALIVWIRLAL